MEKEKFDEMLDILWEIENNHLRDLKRQFIPFMDENRKDIFYSYIDQIGKIIQKMKYETKYQEVKCFKCNKYSKIHLIKNEKKEYDEICNNCGSIIGHDIWSVDMEELLKYYEIREN